MSWRLLLHIIPGMLVGAGCGELLSRSMRGELSWWISGPVLATMASYVFGRVIYLRIQIERSFKRLEEHTRRYEEARKKARESLYP